MQIIARFANEPVLTALPATRASVPEVNTAHHTASYLARDMVA